MLDHEEQLALHLVSVHDITNLELASLPNLAIHHIPVETEHVDQAQQEYNDTPLYCMDDQEDIRVVEVSLRPINRMQLAFLFFLFQLSIRSTFVLVDGQL